MYNWSLTPFTVVVSVVSGGTKCSTGQIMSFLKFKMICYQIQVAIALLQFAKHTFYVYKNLKLLRVSSPSIIRCVAIIDQPGDIKYGNPLPFRKCQYN